MISLILEELHKKKNPKKAVDSQRFFKTAKGEYAAGDIFLGVTVPEIRAISRKWKEADFTSLKRLLCSKIHEERLLALFILVLQFGNISSSNNKNKQQKIYQFYLKHIKYINNWDLVDSSAHKIIGIYLQDKKRDLLYKLVVSASLWERRISIIATFYYIKQKDTKDILALAKILLKDKEDLIHKAVGWMLREVGKVKLEELEQFLEKHTQEMPRTMLRYAIEKLPENKRQYYLKR